MGTHHSNIPNPSVFRRSGDYLEERPLWRAPNAEAVARQVLVFRVVLSALFLALLGRLWYLQIVKAQDYEGQARLNRVRHVPLPAPRGIVSDRNGSILATGRCVYNVAVVPAALPEERRDEVIQRLALLLHTSPLEIADIIDTEATRPFDPVKVASDIDVATLTAIEENRVHLPGVIVETSLARNYVHGQFAAHLLGYIGEVTKDELKAHRRRDLRPGDVVGKLGVEREHDAELIGLRGSELVEVDARGRPVRGLGREAEKPGNSVVLTLDSKLQRVAERELAAHDTPGVIVALNARSGEVRALASSPDFDPNLFGNRVPAEVWEKLNKDKRRPLYNRAIAGLNPPGSVFKLVTALAGLQTGAITPYTSFFCGGGLRLGNYYKRCHRRHGSVNLYGALARSCDTYFYQVSQRTGPTAIAQIAGRLGLGKKTGIDLAGERVGLIPTPAWKAQRKFRGKREPWYGGDTLNMAIGQGYVQTTPLQMACLTAAIANGGTFYQPHLLKKVVDGKGKLVKEFYPQGRSVNIAPQWLEVVRAGMRQAVTSGTSTALKMPHLAVAGKTGSAEDYAKGSKTHAWFVCFAPYDDPRLVVVVMLESAGHGGEVAAPVARKICEAAYPPPSP